MNRVFVLPIGLFARSETHVEKVAFLSIRDAYVPTRAAHQVGKFGFFGGGVEPEDREGSDDWTTHVLSTAKRELREETGDWFDRFRLPGTRTQVWGRSSQDGFARIGSTPDGEYTLFVTAVDGGLASWQYLRNSCREGAALALPLSFLFEKPRESFDRPELFDLLKKAPLVFAW